MPDTGFTRFVQDAYVGDERKPLSKYDRFYPIFRYKTYLGWAIVLSLVLHVLAAPVLSRYRFPNAAATEPPSKVSLEKMAMVTPRPTPPPTPTPPPHTPPPTTRPLTTPRPVALRIAPPKQTTHSTNGSSSETRFNGPKNGVENPQGDITAGSGAAPGNGNAPAEAPAPAAPKPACPEPNVDAHTTQKAVPEYPQAAAVIGAFGTVEVKVTLSATGQVTDASVYRTSGYKALDSAGLLAAKESRYAPEVKDCEPVAGSYIFVAEFAAN